MKISELASTKPFADCIWDNLYKVEHGIGLMKFDVHGYAEWYDKIFEPLEHRPANVIEVGVSGGWSLLLWDKYLKHPSSQIVGIDPLYDLPERKLPGTSEHAKSVKRISMLDDVKKGYSDRVKLYYDNAYDQHTPRKFANNTYDIIIDDGSHITRDKIFFVRNYWRKVKVGGWLVIEDYHWAYDQSVMDALLYTLTGKGQVISYFNTLSPSLYFHEGAPEGLVMVQKKEETQGMGLTK